MWQRLSNFFKRNKSKEDSGDPAINTEMEALAQEANRKARESGSPEDMEHAASVWKLASEAKKNLAEVSTLKGTLRQENLKSWAQILVPLISVLTLGATLYTQTTQQRATQYAQEDSAWRVAIANFSPRPGRESRIDGLMAQVQLKPFMKSERHKQEANELARLILPEIADPEIFADLFDAIEWHNLDEMVGVNRQMSRALDHTLQSLKRLDNTEVVPTPPSNIGGFQPGGQTTPFDRGSQRVPDPMFPGLKGPTIKEILEIQRDELYKIASFVCSRMAAASHVGTFSTENLNLSDTYFYNCDLSKLNFRSARLAKAGFHFVDLTGARFSGVTDIDGSYWDDTAWWEAEEISNPLLQKLMDEYYPGSANDKDLSQPPTKTHYKERIQHLCKSANISCPEQSIKFSEEAPK